MESDYSIPASVLAEFGLAEAEVELLAGGRTNRTLRARSSRVRAGQDEADLVRRDLVIQQLLGSAHSDLLGLMENLVRVTAHLDWQRSTGDRSDSWYPVLVPTENRKPFMMSADGDVWRAFTYREGRILRGPQTVDTLASAAGLYGRFSAETSQLGGPPLIETEPGFHDLDGVYEAFLADVEHAGGERTEALGPDLDELAAIKGRLDALCVADGVSWSPDRVVHNDTKLSNVLFAIDQPVATAVLDLDLAMMGPAWHDVGDLIRSACWHAPSSVEEPVFTVPLVEAVVAAFIESASDSLSDAEIVTFAAAGPRLSLELGIRYLHDHIREHPHLAVAGIDGHLRRGRSNVKLAAEMISAYDALRRLVDLQVEQR